MAVTTRTVCVVPVTVFVSGLAVSSHFQTLADKVFITHLLTHHSGSRVCVRGWMLKLNGNAGISNRALWHHNR